MSLLREAYCTWLDPLKRSQTARRDQVSSTAAIQVDAPAQLEQRSRPSRQPCDHPVSEGFEDTDTPSVTGEYAVTLSATYYAATPDFGAPLAPDAVLPLSAPTKTDAAYLSVPPIGSTRIKIPEVRCHPEDSTCRG